MLRRFEQAGCVGIVLAGTNGEGPSLSGSEKLGLLRVAKSMSALDFILGVASASASEAAELCHGAKEEGAVAALVMPPSYFREAREEGLEAWFRLVLDASPLPLLLYNLPQRTGIALSPSLLSRLSGHPNCAGAKDSSGELANLEAFRAAMPGKALFVGDETLLYPALESGWSGTISGAANLVADRLVQVVREFALDRAAARSSFEALRDTLKSIRSHPQPATHKSALHAAGLLTSPMVLPPLLPIEPDPNLVGLVGGLD